MTFALRAALLFLVFAATPFALAEDNSPQRETPLYRIDAAEFKAGEADIRAVCDSAARELWRYFPDYPLEPFVVTRGKQGPITLFKRNEQREIVLKLDTEKTFWSQYAYQFSHEFCHVLCGFREGPAENRWFEETLCETASLYVMRAMAKSWKERPPYANWRDYRDSLREYVDTIIRNRRELTNLYERGLPAFYREHEAELRKNPTNRELNGTMAVVLLQLFEQAPERWEAIRWLNAETIPPGESFAEFLARWQRAVPEKHRALITTIAKLYGIEKL